MAADRNKSKKKGYLFKIIIGITTIFLIVLLFPKGESIEFEVSEGAIWLYDDLIAPFSFPIKKSEENYRIELIEAEESVLPVFLNEIESSQTTLDSLKNYGTFLIRTIDLYTDYDSVPPVNPTFLSTSSYSVFENIRIQEKNLLRSNSPGLRDLFNASGIVLENVLRMGVLNVQSGFLKNDSMAVRKGNVDIIEPVNERLYFNRAEDLVDQEIVKLNYSSDIERALIEYSIHFLVPNLIYSAELTGEEIEHARNNVSRYTGIVNEDERIIAKHERVTKETILKLESYKEAKGEVKGGEEFLLQGIGKFIHIALVISLLVAYLFLFRKRIFFDNQKIILFSIIILFVSFITFLINQVEVQAPVQFLIFIPAASMLITIMFDSRVGFYSTVILTLVTGALRGNDYTFMAMNLIAGGIAVYSVRDIKNRSQIFRSFLFILIGYFLSILSFGLERFAAWNDLIIEFAFAASNSLISPVLTYGLLIFFERIFRITTDLTLLELSNFDRPLLKELARKAPGTFNHSMTIGTIAEAAAEKTGANPLLARVGSYYHDIGKTITPQNFVENQLDNQNVHENLKPEESVQLITNHIEEGVELARENNLPYEVIDFIPMHHGTNIISFFYDSAKKLYGEENVDINDYRYKGPKPNTKETAIVMLADGCESAVRSIDEPDNEKVKNVIDNIFKARLEDGQLDEAPVTLNDITRMKAEFINILVGQHHKRIKYPKQKEIENGVDEKKLR